MVDPLVELKRSAVLEDEVSQDLAVALSSTLAQALQLVQAGYPVPAYVFGRMTSAAEEYNARVRAVRAAIECEMG